MSWRSSAFPPNSGNKEAPSLQSTMFWFRSAQMSRSSPLMFIQVWGGESCDCGTFNSVFRFSKIKRHTVNLSGDQIPWFSRLLYPSWSRWEGVLEPVSTAYLRIIANICINFQKLRVLSVCCLNLPVYSICWSNNVLMTEMPGNQSPSVANDNSRKSSGISGDSARVNGSGIRAVSAKAPFFSSSAPVDPRS